MQTNKNINKTCLAGILPIVNAQETLNQFFFSTPYKLIALFLTLEVSQTQRDDKEELPAVIFKIHSGMDRGDMTRRLRSGFIDIKGPKFRALTSGTNETIHSVTEGH